MVEEEILEEEITVEDVVISLLERVDQLEAIVSILAENLDEVTIDHHALFMVMRNSGKFSKAAYIKARSILAKDRDGESTTDDDDVEGDDRG